MNKTLERYFIFIIGGGFGLLVNIIITFILTEFFHFWHMLSYSIGLIFNIIVNFTYHRFITFATKDNWIENIIKFITGYFMIVIINWILVYIFTEIFIFSIFRYYYIIVIIFITFLVSIFNYAINKRWVFKK